MPSIDTFLQTAYQFIKALFVRVTKRMYRTAAVLMTGAAVVTVIAFNSVSFGGVGKNAASAHREYPDDVELTEMLQSEETTETESLSEFTILASNEESQHLLGQRLEQGIQDELAKEALEVEVIEREVRMQTQQAAQEAEERGAPGTRQSSLTAMKITVFCRKLCRRRRGCATTGERYWLQM